MKLWDTLYYISGLIIGGIILIEIIPLMELNNLKVIVFSYSTGIIVLYTAYKVRNENKSSLKHKKENNSPAEAGEDKLQSKSSSGDASASKKVSK